LAPPLTDEDAGGGEGDNRTLAILILRGLFTSFVPLLLGGEGETLLKALKFLNSKLCWADEPALVVPLAPDGMIPALETSPLILLT